LTENAHLLDGLLVVDKPGVDDAAPFPMYDAAGQDVARPESTSQETAAEASRSVNAWTSHDVVAWVRRWSGQRRIGHTGTLDPMASGLMLLCLGRTTRIAEFYQHQPKRYRAEVRLGGATDTDDAMGHLLVQRAVPPLDLLEIEQALDAFRGEVQQRAPVYAAIKQEGKALHKRARRGEQVEAPVRTVTFSHLELTGFVAPDRIMLDIECSAGAYIRSLARDLGERLGTCAYLQLLRRTAIGSFTLDDAHTLDAIGVACRAGELAARLLPPGDRLPLPDHRLDDEVLRRLGFGQIVMLAEDVCEPARHLAAARDSQGRLVGIMRRLDASVESGMWQWKAEKWLQ
jgi:tRNA pseudouridine55 synthase